MSDGKITKDWVELAVLMLAVLIISLAVVGEFICRLDFSKLIPTNGTLLIFAIWSVVSMFLIMWFILRLKECNYNGKVKSESAVVGKICSENVEINIT